MINLLINNCLFQYYMKFNLLLYLIHLQLLSYLLNSFLMSINFIINYTIDYLKFI